MAKMKATESDLLFGYCNVWDGYQLYPEQFVSILEYTHPRSAVPRARVSYHSEKFTKEFYTPRIKITRPVIVKSEVKFWYDGFNITARATFYRHPDQQFCDEKTPHIIEAINANGFTLESLSELAEFMTLPIERIRPVLIKNLLNYADELPF